MSLEDGEADPWEAFSSVLWHGAELQLRDRALAQVVATQSQESAPSPRSRRSSAPHEPDARRARRRARAAEITPTTSP